MTQDTPLMPRAVLFDLDGTLMDSSVIIRQVMQDVIREKQGRELPLDYFMQFFGPPLNETFAVLGATPDEVPEYIARYRERYHEVMCDAPLFPGVEELLAELGRRGYVLAIATSKNEPIAREICDTVGLTAHFAGVFGSISDGPKSGKPWVVERAVAYLEQIGVLDPESRSSDAHGYRDDVVMVGDRIHDVEGAAQNGIRTIMVGWTEAEQREQAAAWAVAPNTAGLIDLIAQIGSAGYA